MIVEGPFGNLTLLLTTSKTKIEKTLAEKIVKNININDNNIEINGYKIKSELFDKNNNIEGEGTVNPSFIGDQSIRLWNIDNFSINILKICKNKLKIYLILN